jgi:hypothetical protein
MWSFFKRAIASMDYLLRAKVGIGGLPRKRHAAPPSPTC